jgi:hypothetical protein
MKTMAGKADLIFVSIAAYRDPQFVPTIADCIGMKSAGWISRPTSWGHSAEAKSGSL